MTAGRVFISQAPMIFGNWTPFGAFGADMLFGFTDSLASKLAILRVQIPSQFLLMAPYIATMVVLAGVVDRGQMPADDGDAYEKEGGNTRRERGNSDKRICGRLPPAYPFISVLMMIDNQSKKSYYIIA